MAEKFATIDEYIGAFPEDVRVVLEEIRRRIRQAAPDTGEKISYQIPTITFRGRNVAHFAAWTGHISLYPIPEADEVLAQDLEPFVAGKGTLKFPLRKPVPYDLIERVVLLLIEQRGG